MPQHPVRGFVEAKGSQSRLTLSEAKDIIAKNSRDAVIRCGPIAKEAKELFESLEIYYIENVSLEDVMNYDILAERAENSTRRKYQKRRKII